MSGVWARLEWMIDSSIGKMSIVGLDVGHGHHGRVI